MEPYFNSTRFRYKSVIFPHINIIGARTDEFKPWREWKVTMPYGYQNNYDYEYRDLFERYLNKQARENRYLSLSANIMNKDGSLCFDLTNITPVEISPLDMYWNGSGDPGTFEVTFLVDPLPF